MSSMIYFLVVFIGITVGNFQSEQEFEVKQENLFNNGRSYIITEIGNVNRQRYTIENRLLSLGKKLVLFENGRPIYELKHQLGHIYQKWKIYDVQTGDELATLKHRPSIIHDSYKVKSKRFGDFHISGNIGSHTFTIKKDGHQVAKIHKKHFHLRDTYNIKIEAKQDPAIILLIAIGIDEIRHH